MSRSSFLAPLVGRSSEGVTLVTTAGTVVATGVEAAFDSGTRRRGLLGRDGLDKGSALILAPCNSVHTWFMRFPLDILFVARDGRIVKLRKTCPPWRIAAAFRAFATVEMRAGAIDDLGLTVGDRLKLIG